MFASARLVTLTGIGGVGKTRLALSVAHDIRRAFKNGVYFVQLAGLAEPDLLPHTVLDALGIREQPKKDALDVLCDTLRDHQALLILDSCEHLVEATAGLVDRVLRAAPGVRVLAASRQALRNDGEHLYPVAPLLTPSPSTAGDGTAANYPAVKLFTDRAVAVVPDFKITPANEEAVARLCRRLEGIPLALELAAVRLQVLSLEELAERLDDRFQLLREGSRSLPRRHQTLRAVIDWSYELCTRQEQLAWARSSVFAGSFSFEALEAVCADATLPGSELLDTVGGLIEKSIFIREEHDAQIRFRMLDTIREYGQVRLAEAGEDGDLALRHRNWFAELVAVATREWAGPRQVEWAARLHLDHPNIRLALEYSMTRPAEVGIGIGIAAQPWFWASMDHLNEARMWLDRGLEQLDEPSHEFAWALATRGYIAAFQGDDEALRQLPERALAMATELGDPSTLALAHHVIGFRQALEPGEIRKSIPLFIEAMRQYDETGMARQYHDAVVIELATTYALLHEFERATELVDDLHARCVAVGERWNLSFALWLRGLISLLGSDDPIGAETDLLEALRIKRLFRDTFGLGLTFEVLAWTAAAKGEAERAAVVIGGADRIWNSIGSPHLHEKRARYADAARTRLGAAAFDAARARGRTMQVDEMIGFASREDAGLRASAASKSRLTRREREVAELVADGMSNQQIATRLVISVRTAEGHVEKILAKQGFKTRAQIAAWVARQHAADTR
ncbi:LuxR C-terminal-related transcriptional regulator [Streptomyces sp. NPDC006197]|uniref:ATP-binding protein n=1 Tax=Streptomyces sp. NPDC006197 TaxID=3156685 RepID=UPI0033A2C2F4